MNKETVIEILRLAFKSGLAMGIMEQNDLEFENKIVNICADKILELEKLKNDKS